MCPSREGLPRPGRLGDLFACGWSGAGCGGHSCSQRCAFSKPSLGRGLCQAQVCSGHTASQQVHQESQRGVGRRGGRFHYRPQVWGWVQKAA